LTSILYCTGIYWYHSYVQIYTDASKSLDNRVGEVFFFCSRVSYFISEVDKW